MPDVSAMTSTTDVGALISMPDVGTTRSTPELAASPVLQCRSHSCSTQLLQRLLPLAGTGCWLHTPSFALCLLELHGPALLAVHMQQCI
jgi:hypothetical protein